VAVSKNEAYSYGMKRIHNLYNGEDLIEKTCIQIRMGV
jgi:hypothetical protein